MRAEEVQVTALRAAYGLFRFVPRRHKVTFLSRQADEPSPDLVAVAAAVKELDPTVEVVILAKMLTGGLRARVGYAAHMLTQLRHLASSRVLVLDTYAVVASALNHPPGLTIVQMWHALGAFKKFGLAATGTPLGPSKDLAATMRLHANYDWVFASGPACIPAYAAAFGVPADRVLVAPLPRIDELVDPQRRQSVRERILRRYPDLAGRRIVLYAPTFQRAEDTTPMDRVGGAGEGLADANTREPDPRNVAALAQVCGRHDWTLVVRQHPLDTGALPPGVPDLDDFSTLEWLTVADALVTDYSSVVFEAAILGLPIYRYLPPGIPRLAGTDFFLDWDRDVPGPVTTTPEALVAALDASGYDTEAVAEFARRYVEVPTHGTAAQAIAAQLLRWA